jgi:hypothetical protein
MKYGFFILNSTQYFILLKENFENNTFRTTSSINGEKVGSSSVGATFEIG